ncbi:MAG: hypothetical protein EBU90_06605 [Proteobacteria bacterium]|nr:hypothetical protein [Pseudomonadota bacterium]NBP15066.1 hypothetical protein [bacterium]
MVTPADQIPEFSRSITSNFTSINDASSIAESIPGLDLNSIADPAQLTSLLGTNSLPNFLPSTNFNQLAEISALSDGLDVNSLLGSLTPSDIEALANGSLDIQDPFAAFNAIEGIKDTICNFNIPNFTPPDFESLFNMKFEDIEKKFLSLLPDFNNPPNFDPEKFIKDLAKSFADKIVSSFEGLYKKLFECQPKDN